MMPPTPATAALSLHLVSHAQALAQVKMVTGDQRLIAIETCRRLGMGTNIMEGSELTAGSAGAMDLATKVTEVDGFAGVYPEHKHRIVTALQSKGRLVGMTGVSPGSVSPRSVSPPSASPRDIFASDGLESLITAACTSKSRPSPRYTSLHNSASSECAGAQGKAKGSWGF